MRVHVTAMMDGGGGGCAGGCKGGCYGCNTCVITCAPGCHYGCGGCDIDKCKSGCKTGCKTTCVNGCGGGCKYGCSSCTGSCKNGCGGHCKENCLGNCKNSCGNNCSGAAYVEINQINITSGERLQAYKINLIADAIEYEVTRRKKTPTQINFEVGERVDDTKLNEVINNLKLIGWSNEQTAEGFLTTYELLNNLLVKLKIIQNIVVDPDTGKEQLD